MFPYIQYSYVSLYTVHICFLIYSTDMFPYIHYSTKHKQNEDTELVQEGQAGGWKTIMDIA